MWMKERSILLREGGEVMPLLKSVTEKDEQQKKPDLPPWFRKHHPCLPREVSTSQSHDSSWLSSLWGPCRSSHSSLVNYFQVQAYSSQEWAHAQQGSLGRKKILVFSWENLIQVLNSLLSRSCYCKPNSVEGFTKAQDTKDICSEVTQRYDVD